jgi:hypothetical protein
VPVTGKKPKIGREIRSEEKENEIGSEKREIEKERESEREIGSCLLLPHEEGGGLSTWGGGGAATGTRHNNRFCPALPSGLWGGGQECWGSVDFKLLCIFGN